jgi:HK97 family phage major capsid protein
MKDAPATPLEGVQAETAQRYSIVRAVRRAMERGESHGFHPDGLEGEVSREICRRSGKSPRGFYMPHEARLDTTITGAGAAATVWPPRMFIDVLRAKLVIEALGGQITSLSVDKGVVQLPVQTAGTPVTWVSEGSNAASNTGLAVSSVTFTPHTALCNTGVSRFMKDVSAPGFDDWLYADLAKQIAVAVDAVALNGLGAASNQPLGILQTPNTTSYTLAADTAGNGGAPAYLDLVMMEELLGNANADSRADARLGLCTSPNGRSKLRRTDSSAMVAGTSGQWCWPQLYNTVLGHPAAATTNVPNNFTKGSGTGLTAMIFADWTNCIVNLFSAVDLLVNPFTITTLGYYSIYAYQEVDVQLARAAGFLVAGGMITT